MATKDALGIKLYTWLGRDEPVPIEHRAYQLGNMSVCILGHVDANLDRAGAWCREPFCRTVNTRKVADYPGVISALLLAEASVANHEQAWTDRELWELLNAAEPWRHSLTAW